MVALSEQRKLLQRSGDRCAFERCRRQLTASPTPDDPLVAIGQIAHIVGQSPEGPRGGDALPIDQRDRYENLILLCGDHHKAVDSQPNFYTIERLLAMKAAHETWVAETLGGTSDLDLCDLVMDSTANGLRRMSELNPYDLGVSASRYGDRSNYGESDPYVRRSNGDFDSALTSALRRHDFVVVAGPSKAGKTRSAFEIALRTFPDYRLVHPWPHRLSDVIAHPTVAHGDEDLILWLDDLEDYLVSADPLTVTMLRRLSDRAGVTKVVATLRSEQRALLLGDAGELPDDDDEHMAHPAMSAWYADDAGIEGKGAKRRSAGIRRSLNRVVSADDRGLRRVLQAAKTLTLEPTSENPSEQRRAAEAYPYENLQFGLGAQLAGGPEMVRMYRDAHAHNAPLHTVIRVAVDWSRCGRADPIDEDLLADSVRTLLARERRDKDFGTEQIARAIEQARTPRTSDGKAVALITHTAAGGIRAYRPFVYLVSADDGQDGPERDIQAEDWFRAQSGAEADQAHAVAITAYHRGSLIIALELAQRAALLGSSEAMFLAGYLRQTATDAADLDSAVEWYRRAARAGHVGAMKNLAEALNASRDRDLADEAEEWFSRAAATGDARAMHMYADYLLDVTDADRRAEARVWLEKAATAGDTSAMSHLGNLLLRAAPVDVEGARSWLERAIEAGSSSARVNLGHLLVHHYDPPAIKEARKLFRDAAASGNKWGLIGEAEMIAKHTRKPDLKAAKRLYAQAANGSSDPYALSSYGNFLYRQANRPAAEAEEWLRRAAVTGNASAKFDLAELLLDSTEPSRVDEGVLLLAEAAEAGVIRAMCRLATLHKDNHPGLPKVPAADSRWRWLRKRPRDTDGDLPAAMKWYARAANGGHVHAMIELSNLCMYRCQPPDYATSRKWLERAALTGNVDAMYTLGHLIGYTWSPPDLRTGVEWYTRAAEAGHVLAMLKLGQIARTDRGAAARETTLKWLTSAAQGGLVEAMLELGDFSLADLEDVDAAMTWYRKAAEKESTAAMTALAELYTEHFQPPHQSEIRRWLTRAANLGDQMAMWWLADVLEQTEPVRRLEAARWREKAAVAGQGAVPPTEGDACSV